MPHSKIMCIFFCLVFPDHEYEWKRNSCEKKERTKRVESMGVSKDQNASSNLCFVINKKSDASVSELFTVSIYFYACEHSEMLILPTTRIFRTVQHSDLLFLSSSLNESIRMIKLIELNHRSFRF